ncbi:hypothetical protein CONPUDRAFT_87784 [Coniophora puteana RWD-64-598 SS2]|uniref:Nudix hydrolase domain-containing protein n=1 Tax=Coniophora puteana (strain RWD-64-598) TaxID=741705 RepID=A0A5M3N1R2_CONPW|nr:uncharacterized protein CONPUDRAFT_87784 [Coniophora puteana RWD-64-598 SS2]EIW85330.1 hypothetical protein CONPUDRAFT_87784 [Coniophora puteana RWD-64-598 SS2]
MPELFEPKVTSTEELASSNAKWISLKKLHYTDQEGRSRVWECAERRTRGASGVDAVSILVLLKSKTNAFPLSTVIIEQFRPPAGKYVIGLIDKDETPEQAAIRELEEETGYKADSIAESSPVTVADPGMTTANMKLVVANVLLDDKLETPDSKLDDGEFIVKRVVALDQLHDELINSRLSHLASGYNLAQRIAKGL